VAISFVFRTTEEVVIMARVTRMPYLIVLTLQYNSFEKALHEIRYRKCLFCGNPISGGKEFCSRGCMRSFMKWRKQASTSIGTIVIRGKRKDETWEEYHEYLESLKLWKK